MLAPLLLALGAAASASFTPVDMLTAPRPQAAIAAPDGKHAISVVDQWDANHDSTSRTVYLLDLDGLEQSGDKEPQAPKAPRELFTTVPGHAGEFVWLSETTVAYLNGSTMHHFSVAANASGRTMHLLDFPEGSEPSAISYERESHTLAFSAAVWTDNEDLEMTAKGDKKWADRGTTGVVYDDLMVRHWDTWRTPGRVYTLAATTLNRRRKENGEDEFATKHKFTNLLKGTGLHSQVDAISADQFSLSSSHIAIAMKPKHMQVATHTRMEVYLINMSATEARPLQLTSGAQGAVSNVVFSPDHSKVAWLEMAKDGYESDKRVVTVHTLSGNKLGKTKRWTAEWDRSPQSLVWDLDSEGFVFLAESRGRVLPYHLSQPGRLPTPLAFKNSTSAITPLTASTFLLSTSSMTRPTEHFFLDLEEGPGHDPHKLPREQLLQLTHYSEKHIGGRLDSMKGEEMWFEGEDGRQVMAWVLKPAGWKAEDKDKSYPLAFLIHGGPQGAWEDSWSTRWNPAVYAAAGYFVVAVNPTGSTGYGQDFTDRIQMHWGDRPFQDLYLGYRAALDKYTQIDPDRTAALGASYGGYMVNWINGHNIFGFKALVYHDGMLSTTDTFYSTEEVWFPLQEFGGSPLEARAMYEKWNPMNFVQEWSTPQLVIQGGKDYRLADTQAIGTFTALQLQGVPSRFLYFPDENHWVLKASNSRKWHHEVLRWLDEWVGSGKGKAEGEAEGEEEALVVQA